MWHACCTCCVLCHCEHGGVHSIWAGISRVAVAPHTTLLPVGGTTAACCIHAVIKTCHNSCISCHSFTDSYSGVNSTVGMIRHTSWKQGPR